MSEPKTNDSITVSFSRKEFMEFIEWCGLKGEIVTIKRSGEETFNFFGNMGNTFSLDNLDVKQKSLSDFCNWSHSPVVARLLNEYRSEVGSPGYVEYP